MSLLDQLIEAQGDDDGEDDNDREEIMLAENLIAGVSEDDLEDLGDNEDHHQITKDDNIDYMSLAQKQEVHDISQRTTKGYTR